MASLSGLLLRLSRGGVIAGLCTSGLFPHCVPSSVEARSAGQAKRGGPGGFPSAREKGAGNQPSFPPGTEAIGATVRFVCASSATVPSRLGHLSSVDRSSRQAICPWLCWFFQRRIREECLVVAVQHGSCCMSVGRYIHMPTGLRRAIHGTDIRQSRQSGFSQSRLA